MHRTGRYNEISGRYSELETEFFTPADWRMQNLEGNKQGSSSEILTGYDVEIFNDRLETNREEVARLYGDMLDAGVAKELARIDLPLSTYTEFFFNIDLHNLLHFITLRLDGHAQPEIQVYAEAMLKLISPIVPLTIGAWEKYTKNAVTLTADEAKEVKAILQDYYATLSAGLKGKFFSEKG